jgi:hypothetical protein
VRACAPPTDLPLDAIIIEEEDTDVWLEEQLEINGLRADPRTPRALQMPIGSFELPNGRYGQGHAFQGGGVSLSSYDWEEAVDSGGRPGDSSRLALAPDLLDSVNFLHCRGSPHLWLFAKVHMAKCGGRRLPSLIKFKTCIGQRSTHTRRAQGTQLDIRARHTSAHSRHKDKQRKLTHEPFSGSTRQSPR